MRKPLDDWQERLDRHFCDLAYKRDGSGLPLFALEHGLTTEETEEIGRFLREYMASGKRLGVYWLLWVVYATEIGYHYTGGEYWQSFEEQTPGWEFQHRYSLRRWFRKFQTEYQGFVPSGSWAEHFSNIAWPITHAILPKYLQYHFASTLYQQRYRLAGLGTLDSVSVGRLLAAYAYKASTRFEQFLQQEELTGRIVLGLFGQNPKEGHEPIYPAALERILADLDRVHSTRSWVRDTRRTVIDRFKGIGQGAGPSMGGLQLSDEEEPFTDSFVQPDLRPNLLLRYSGGGKWAVAVEVPSFAPFAALHSDLRTFLMRTRCRLAGATDTKPAGWTLSGNRIGILKSWPDTDKPLLEFQKTHEVLDRLLHTDCRISSGPIWLFRIGGDGRAREIRGRNVHPGVAYLLVSKDEFFIASDTLFAPCTLECDGVHAVRISVPESLSTKVKSQIEALGLEVARTVQVWPAGLPCRSWDGEGQSEWLTTECAQLGILHDHPVTSYHVCLNDNKRISVDAQGKGEPVFIQLEPLPAGKHRLTVTAQREDEPLTGYVELNVREPEPWIPGVPAHTGLVVIVDPHDADLDEFWANDVDLFINGPESHSVTCILSLENSNGDQIYSEQVGQAIKLPVKADVWRRQFSRFLEDYEDANWNYWEASSATLRILAGELGQYVLRFDREVLPVRWVVSQQHRKIILRVADDTGLEGEANCRFFSMDYPTKSDSVELSKLLVGLSPEPPGGLYVATHGDHSDAIIISNIAEGDGFQVLGVNPEFADIQNGSTSVQIAIRTMAFWINARLIGSLAEYRRNQIVKKLHSVLYLKLCGQHWANAESMFVENPNSKQVANNLYSKIVAKPSGFGSVLERDRKIFREDMDAAFNWYFDLARRFEICIDKELCKFAVQLACAPYMLPRIGDADLNHLVQKSVSNPPVLKGVRYATLFLNAVDGYDLFKNNRRRLE